MNLKEAKEYLEMYFENFTELRSYSHEVTEHGVINKSHLNQLTDEELINVAQDAKDDISAQVSEYF